MPGASLHTRKRLSLTYGVRREACCILVHTEASHAPALALATSGYNAIEPRFFKVNDIL